MFLYFVGLVCFASANFAHPNVELGLPPKDPEDDESVKTPPFDSLPTERIILNDIRALEKEEEKERDAISRGLRDPHLEDVMKAVRRNEKMRSDEEYDKRNDLKIRYDKEVGKRQRWSRLEKSGQQGGHWSRLTKGGDKRGDAVTKDEMKGSRSVNTYKRTAEGADSIMKPCRLSPEEKTEALNVHRKFREIENASNMWQMTWDESLAELTQGLVDQCVFKHANLYFPNGTRTGQNLGAIVGNNSTITKVVELFYKEKSDYDFNNHQWKGVVGHYLQSIQVGCAKNFCPKLKIETDTVQEEWDNAVYWACNYSPAASFKLRPFGDGSKCSKCMVPKGKGLGVKCVEGTCQACKMDGSDSECRDSLDPMDFAKPDTDPMCPYAKSMHWCKPYYPWAKTNCQQACGFSDLVPEKIELELEE